jgi:hypothetical protein
MIILSTNQSWSMFVEQVITAGGNFHAEKTVWAQIKYGD